jgi:hypothetical protein
MCGTTRNAYENYSLSNESPGFDSHVKRDHNIWNYVFFIAYLKKKDCTEDIGVETFVRKELRQSSIDWVPSRTGYVLELEGKTGEQPLV